jgi:phosphoribosylpyrophosphate synthetase
VLLDAIRDRYGSQPLTIISPDAGGVERARAYAKRLNASLAIIDKRREAANVSQVMNIIGDVSGRTCVIVDDIVDTAGTLTEAAARSRTPAPRWCRPRSRIPCSRARRSSGSASRRSPSS